MNSTLHDKRRLFTALLPPADFIEKVAALPRKNLAARWVDLNDLHITLRFLGDVESEHMPQVMDALLKVRAAPFGVELDGLGLFENAQHNILYGAIPSRRGLENLSALICEKLIPLGFDFGTRPYIPHLTLARLEKNANIKAYLKSAPKAGIKARFMAERFHLMESIPGAPYKSLGEFKLRR